MKDHTTVTGGHPPSAEFTANAHVKPQGYVETYAHSIADPGDYWGREAKRLDWIRPFTKVKDTDFTLGQVKVSWFGDGTLNVAANCIDRHLATRGDQTAIIWEPDDPEAQPRHITYAELHDQVSRLANVLKAHGVGKGDRVVIYLPMIPEAAYTMLACARIGAIHSVVFAGFSPEALSNRIIDSQAKVLVTADRAPRGGRKTALKDNADKALAKVDARVDCLVVSSLLPNQASAAI